MIRPGSNTCTTKATADGGVSAGNNLAVVVLLGDTTTSNVEDSVATTTTRTTKSKILSGVIMTWLCLGTTCITTIPAATVRRNKHRLQEQHPLSILALLAVVSCGVLHVITTTRTGLINSSMQDCSLLSWTTKEIENQFYATTSTVVPDDGDNDTTSAQLEPIEHSLYYPHVHGTTSTNNKTKDCVFPFCKNETPPTIHASSDGTGTQDMNVFTPLQIKARMYLTSKKNNDKNNNNSNGTSVDSIPPKTLGGFVHLGKTGGSSLSTLLRNGCHSFLSKPCPSYLQQQHRISKSQGGVAVHAETAVSQLTTYYHVPDFNNDYLFQHYHEHDFIVFTLRDPLQRLISSYLYSHPENEVLHLFQAFQNTNQFIQKLKELGSIEAVFQRRSEIYKQRHKEKINLYSCFSTLESFSYVLAQEQRNDSPTNTTQKGIQSIFEQIQMDECVKSAMTKFSHNTAETIMQLTAPHLYWDLTTLEQRLQLLQNNRSNVVVTNNSTTTTAGDGIEIMVIRTEHQNDDWVNVNKYLGQEEPVQVPFYHLRDSSKLQYAVRNELSQDGKKRLCIALKKEYATYLRLLHHAVNLQAQDVLESLMFSRSQCPWLNLSMPADEMEHYTLQ